MGIHALLDYNDYRIIYVLKDFPDGLALRQFLQYFLKIIPVLVRSILIRHLN